MLNICRVQETVREQCGEKTKENIKSFRLKGLGVSEGKNKPLNARLVLLLLLGSEFWEIIALSLTDKICDVKNGKEGGALGSDGCVKELFTLVRLEVKIVAFEQSTKTFPPPSLLLKIFYKSLVIL